MLSKGKNSRFPSKSTNGERGFSLIETVIALVILMIAVMGVFAAFTYATVYNSGNSRRSQALSIMQREIEILRSVKFNPLPAVVDTRLAGGVKSPMTVTAADNASYRVDVTVDDDPFTDGIQVDNTKLIKEITISVTPVGSNNTWVTASRTRAIFRRVCSN